jgi:hypothetical protein
MIVIKFNEYINESSSNEFSNYYDQIMNRAFIEVSDEMWEEILLDGYPEEVNNWQGDFNQTNYKFISLEISEEDQTGLKSDDEIYIDKWNDFDIWLKEEAKLYPDYIDMIDYDKGTVFIIKYEPKIMKNESSMFAPTDGFSPGASFGHTALSSINTGGSIQPKDPNLSFDAWDMHKNNMRDRMSRLSDLMSSVFMNTSIPF